MQGCFLFNPNGDKGNGAKTKSRRKRPARNTKLLCSGLNLMLLVFSFLRDSRQRDMFNHCMRNNPRKQEHVKINMHQYHVMCSILFGRPSHYDWFLDLLICWFLDLLITWLIDWFVDWLIHWFLDWLITWLIDALIDWCLFAWNYRELANTLHTLLATSLGCSSNPQPSHQGLSVQTTWLSLDQFQASLIFYHLISSVELNVNIFKTKRFVESPLWLKLRNFLRSSTSFQVISFLHCLVKMKIRQL